MIEQAVDPGDTDVVDAPDVTPHDLSGNRGFFCDGKIGGAAAEDGDAGLLRPGATIDRDGASGFVVHGVWHGFLNLVETALIRSRNQDAIRAAGEARGNFRDLPGRLSLSQDDLRKGVAEGAMMVDLCETDVLVGQQAQLRNGGLDACGAGGDALQKISNLMLVHEANFDYTAARGRPSDRISVMRIWDVDPAILCRSHLLGEHRELHAVWAILTEDRQGYRNHPETRRWRGRLRALYGRHECLVDEMRERGYAHRSPLDERLARGYGIQRTYVDTPEQQRLILEAKDCPCPITSQKLG
jgi:hypothetical protein